MKPAERQTASGRSEVVALVRRTAATLRHADEPAALVTCLNAFLRLLPELRHAWIELDANGPARPVDAEFAARALTLPFRAGQRAVGALRRGLAGEPLDAPRLHLLGATADLLGAILDQVGRARAHEDTRAMLTCVLEQLPFGAACYLPTGSLFSANAHARVFIDAPAGARAIAGWLSADAPATGARVRALRAGDRVALAHLHPGMVDAPRPVGTVIFLFDLADKAREFVAAVTTQTYRALWLRQPLALAVLAAADRLPELLAVAGAVVHDEGAAAACGPLEADAVGILVPGAPANVLRARLRLAAGLRDIPDLRVGVGELAAGQKSPDALITAVIGALQPVELLQRPAVLLCDTSPAVNESLSVALRGDCEVRDCPERTRVPALLAAHPFDAIFSKVELDEWEDDLGFLHQALALQPGLKPFVVTDASGLEAAALPQLPPDTPVFRKPFRVAAVRQAVRRVLLAPGSL